MGWFIGFVALLAFALPIDVKFSFGGNSVKTMHWDGPEFFAAIIRYLKG